MSTAERRNVGPDNTPQALGRHPAAASGRHRAAALEPRPAAALASLQASDSLRVLARHPGPPWPPQLPWLPVADSAPPPLRPLLQVVSVSPRRAACSDSHRSRPHSQPPTCLVHPRLHPRKVRGNVGLWLQGTQLKSFLS